MSTVERDLLHEKTQGVVVRHKPQLGKAVAEQADMKFLKQIRACSRTHRILVLVRVDIEVNTIQGLIASWVGRANLLI